MLLLYRVVVNIWGIERDREGGREGGREREKGSFLGLMDLYRPGCNY